MSNKRCLEGLFLLKRRCVLKIAFLAEGAAQSKHTERTTGPETQKNTSFTSSDVCAPQAFVLLVI